MVAPLRKNDVPIKQSVAPASKVVVLPKKVVVPSKALHKPAPLATPNQSQLKPTAHEVSFPYRLHYSFNLDSEIQKLKIPFPLIELMKNDAFKTSIMNSLQPKVHIDTDLVNLEDDKPIVTLGPVIEDLKDSFPPFYISLKTHDKILKNMHITCYQVNVLCICCNLTDHIRLPIIHTKTYINIEQRQEKRTDRIKQIILSK